VAAGGGGGGESAAAVATGVTVAVGTGTGAGAWAGAAASGAGAGAGAKATGYMHWSAVLGAAITAMTCCWLPACTRLWPNTADCLLLLTHTACRHGRLDTIGTNSQEYATHCTGSDMLDV